MTEPTKFGVLGSGDVAQAIASRLLELGCSVKLGTRDGKPRAKTSGLVAAYPSLVSVGTFGDSAAFGTTLFNGVRGTGVLDALHQARPEDLRGKVLIDISNPLDFSQGMPPALFVCNRDSLAEQIQRAFPDLKVVKTLNIVTAQVMVDASRVPGAPTMFVAGNDPEARRQVADLLRDWFGWQDLIDLGDLTAARGMEMLLPLWIRLWTTLGTPDFAFKVLRSDGRGG